MNEIVVRVEFVDEQTGKTFAETDVPVSSLPQSFEAETHLEIADQHWDVVTANPMTADLFSRSRKLVLTLRRAHIGRVNTTDILLTLPTICDEIPPITPGTSKLNKYVFELHEDDWRQTELISINHAHDIQAEISDVQQIYKTSAVGGGFRTLHVRKRITTALNLPFHGVLSAFPNAHLYEGIAYERIAGLIDGGFGFETGGCVFFGEQHQNVVTALCLAWTQDERPKALFSNQLKSLMENYGLVLVDWCRCTAFRAETLQKFWLS